MNGTGKNKPKRETEQHGEEKWTNAIGGSMSFDVDPVSGMLCAKQEGSR